MAEQINNEVNTNTEPIINNENQKDKISLMMDNYTPSNDDVNDILAKYVKGKQISKRHVISEGFEFEVTIPNKKLLRMADKFINEEIGDRMITNSEYHDIRNVNMMTVFLTRLSNVGLLVKIESEEDFMINKNLIIETITPGLEVMILMKMYELQQADIEAFNPDRIKNS